MSKTALPINHDLRRAAALLDDGSKRYLAAPIEDAVGAISARPGQRRAKELRQGHRGLLRAASMALTLVPVAATADPLFTLPAPPFALPMVPSVSGDWTVMVGVGGAYKPDFEGPIGPCSARSRSLLSVVPALRSSFVARATVQASHSSTSATFVPAPSPSSWRHESNITIP